MGLRVSGGLRLQSPPGLTARPTPARVRQAVMNMLAAELPGCSWLDLCSGSGAMACEALRRGAARVVAVEQDRRNAAVARANLEAVAASLAGATGPAPQVRVYPCEVLRWLRQGHSGHGEAAFDLIYADPPYAADLYGPLAQRVGAGLWLRRGGELLLECSSQRVPALPRDWELGEQRRYGSTTVLRLRLLPQGGGAG